jgi:hypothetical protein
MAQWNVSNAVDILFRTANARVVNAASDMPTTWADDAWHFALNVVALLAFTAFATACIVIVGIEQVNCVVRDLPIAISVRSLYTADSIPSLLHTALASTRRRGSPCAMLD